ncbi:MAG TPA: hypothetical protein DCE42_01745 [Myxococcales bacterium]|nr:hypothetical protein [Deltaproteobacteria bacterium]HAA53447.1 hypothetical protein [Myxococcales bacterium]|tara:strand:- start:972 stop:1559 length:588 start_codon:yes stop_codon:yes gene_type:complete
MFLSVSWTATVWVHVFVGFWGDIPKAGRTVYISSLSAPKKNPAGLWLCASFGLVFFPSISFCVGFVLGLSLSKENATIQSFKGDDMRSWMCLLGIVVGLLFFVPQASATKVHYVKYSSRADITAYEVRYASRANCKVYLVKYASRASNKDDGLWFVTKYSSRADKKIYWASSSSSAKLKVFFVKYASRASKSCPF